MQLMVVDVTGQPFPQFLQKTVLGPSGMTSSSFEQPLPNVKAALTAAGYYADGSPVRGRWHVYPEMAAAGLWTTPTDLAKWAIEVQETLAGRGHGVISTAMARQFVTEQKGGSGLGVGVQGTGRSLRFSHGGRDEGFDALLEAGAETGDGVAIMINANDNSRLMGRVRDYVQRSWGFSNVSSPPAGGAPSATAAVRIDRSRLATYAGYYEASENNMVALVPNPDGSGMQVLVDGLPGASLLALDSTTFGSNERAFRVRFSVGGRGTATGVTLRPGEPRERQAPRVVPLPSTLAPVTDPDPTLGKRVLAAIDAVRQGGEALAAAPDVTPGAKQDFGGGANPALGSAATAAYLGEEDVSGRGIRRHGGEVARVRLYRTQTPAGTRYLLVHLTRWGQSPTTTSCSGKGRNCETAHGRNGANPDGADSKGRQFRRRGIPNDATATGARADAPTPFSPSGISRRSELAPFLELATGLRFNRRLELPGIGDLRDWRSRHFAPFAVAPSIGIERGAAHSS
jgi:hypothetical protein